MHTNHGAASAVGPTALAWLAVAVVVVAFFVTCRILHRRRTTPATRRATGRRGSLSPKPLLSGWEASALPRIVVQCPSNHHVCPQAHVRDFVAEAGSPHFAWAPRHRAASNAIVDFLVVDQAGMPVLAIELDDRTHDRPDRKARDAALNDLLASAGIKLVRFKPGQPIDLGRVSRQFG